MPDTTRAMREQTLHDEIAAPQPSERSLPPAPRRRRRIGGQQLLSFVAGLVAVGAIAASAWIYTDTQRDIRRVSTEMAQIRLSLELFNQQRPSAAPAVEAPASDALLDLSNRLAILEESWRAKSAAAPAPGTLPALPAQAATPQTTASGDDCMPPGTRFLVTGGDNYPVCGNGAEVNVSAVEAGYVALVDGTTIPNGGNALLRGTKCMVAVVSSGADGMTGYAELRVTC